MNPDPKHYFLSMCICTNRVRVRRYDRAHDECANCGHWIPRVPETVEEWEREQRRLVWAFFALGLLALGAAVLGVVL